MAIFQKNKALGVSRQASGWGGRRAEAGIGKYDLPGVIVSLRKIWFWGLPIFVEPQCLGVMREAVIQGIDVIENKDY